MTLLESIVAFVILAVAAVVCLDLSRGATSLERSSIEWSAAVANADAALALAAADPAASADPDLVRADVRIARRRYRDGVDLLEASVPVGGGRRFTMTRLVSSGVRP